MAGGTYEFIVYMLIKASLTADFFRRQTSQATLTWTLFLRLKGAALWLRLACPDSEGVGLGIAGRSGFSLRSICWLSVLGAASSLTFLCNGRDPGIYVNASVHISSGLDRKLTGLRIMIRLTGPVQSRTKGLREMHRTWFNIRRPRTFLFGA